MRSDDFAELYRDYLPRVLNYMRVRVGDEALAQDLAATTFERAFAKRGQLRNRDAFAAWLFRIARNELRQHFRRRGRRGDSLPLAAALGVPDSNPLPEEEVCYERFIHHYHRVGSRIARSSLWSLQGLPP